jgi:alkanesulfonate monooxygenase SsuD/methylene tetrahydromethanopterin reductase-like flavin-dependent oxidoreductase (luciferase family)
VIRFGVTLPQFTAERDDFIGGALRAEAAGLDSIWVFDHLWPLSGGKARPILECWTALGYVAAATERITIGTLVTRSTLRHPAVLAKMAETIADIAPDRLTIVIGSGDEASRDENVAFGLPFLSGAARFEQLRDTVDVVRARVGTKAPVWVAGRSEEVRRMAGESADGWNAWEASAAEFAEEAATVRAAARGRTVETTWAGLGRSDDLDALAARLRSIAAAGASHLMCVFPDARTPGVYERFAGVAANVGRSLRGAG